MSRNLTYGAAALVWLSITLVVWAVAVPQWLSLAGLAWLNTFVFALFTVLLAVQRTGRPSRSIAGILYDTEHPGRPGPTR
jgi:hypothetical protein